MKRPSPYLAATGFVQPYEVRALAAQIRDAIGAPRGAFAPHYAPRRLVVATLVSAKTLRGVAVENRRYPNLDTARSVVDCAHAHGFVGAVHYNTRAQGDDLGAELTTLGHAIPYMRMLQLNVERPSPGSLLRFRERWPDVEIILQLNPATRGGDGAWDAAFIYASVVDHVLLDLSRGEGRDLNVAAVAHDVTEDAPIFHAAGVRLGVAGGLGPDAQPVLDELYATVGRGPFDALSFDAESRLRIPSPEALPGAKQQDDLDVTKVGAWFELFERGCVG